MKNGFKLYQDLTVLKAERDWKKHYTSLFLCLYFSKLVKTESGYITQNNVPAMLKALETEKSSLLSVANTYKPRIILKKSATLYSSLSIRKEGPGSNVDRILDDFEKLDDSFSTLLLFDKKKVVAIHFSSKKERFTPYLAFDPCVKGNRINLYYFKSRRLVKLYIKDKIDVSLLRFNVVKYESNESTEKFDDPIVDDKNRANIAKVQKVGRPMELSPPDTKELEMASPTGFTNFIDQFITGKKKVEPTDRLLITHEKEIKILRSALQKEKEFSSKLFQMILKLQKEIESASTKKMGEVKLSEKLKTEVEEIKKLNKFRNFDEMSTCVVCMTKPKDTVIMPCRHLCVCGTCFPGVKANFGVCPICQQTIKSSVGGIKYV